MKIALQSIEIDAEGREGRWGGKLMEGAMEKEDFFGSAVSL